MIHISQNDNGQQRAAHSIWRFIAILIVIFLLVVAFTLIRHGGRFGEVDTATFSFHISSVRESGRIVPGPNLGYPNGYGFPVMGTFITYISGLSLSGLQRYGAILLAAWIVFPAWLLYREFSPSSKVALLATIILLFQPDFLFPILRGTHEKFTRGLMLLTLYLLLRSIRSRSNLRLFSAFVIAFYLAAFAMITLNSMLSSSFILAVLLAVVLSWLAVRRTSDSSQSDRATMKRLLLILTVLFGLIFLFIFYLYPPARHDLHLLNTASDQLAALFLDFESAGVTEPYQTVSFGWISLPVYFAVSAATWLLLAATALIWLAQSGRWLIRGRRPQGQHELLLWAFYGAFAAIGATTILTDMSGFLSRNLQIRAFPAFAMLAAPLLAAWLIRHIEKSSVFARVARAGFLVVIGLLVFLSVFKSTNEPLFSNKWSFHIPGEVSALKWAESALDGRPIWAGFDERLQTTLIISTERDLDQKIDAFGVNDGVKDLLGSDVISSRGIRLSLTLPAEPDSFTTYDNGQSQVYHLRPRTPFQR